MSFQRPSRYINSEWNSIHKEAEIKVALAFPDVYEVGMSHLGLRILYHIINNNIPNASAERVFAPWVDLEEALKKSGHHLTSLESARPIREFDIVGFSLQYELSFTSVLNMLHLGGIPFRTAERLEKKQGPLIIAGGPSTLNPFPMSPFIDAFLVGDGEDAIREILGTYSSWKKENADDRVSLLRALSEIEGIFVPALGRDRRVNRRIISSLEDAPYPDSPVLPFANIVHDRVNIEIARGCSMGCRFCQAGMAYRPVRERSPLKILELAERSLKNTGYEDVSFTSLSSGDYSCLNELMREFNRRFSEKRISISLPSLRVASVQGGMLKEIKSVRKTGFTMAPEAGTERLRAVINKDFSEDDYIRAIETLFREGWHNLKLYFMVGLPTETWEDVEAIPEMVLRAIRISRKLTGKHVNMSVGISSFIPKAHTPFQWYGQNDMETLREKTSFLKKALLKKGIKYKGHSEEMALLEAVFARGDEQLAPLLEKALASGCRLDGWTEMFDFKKWQVAMEASNIDATAYANREYAKDDPLPWDNISTGVTRDYLWQEYQNALSGTVTGDCRKSCSGCGLQCGPAAEAERPVFPEHRPAAMAKAVAAPLQDSAVRIRLEYSKTGRARYISHLELTTAMLRAMRRADFPMKYSGGFHPLPKISFGPTLSVGYAGLREYLDLELSASFEPEQGLERLNQLLPEGLSAHRLAVLYGKEKSLNSFVVRYIYSVKREGCPGPGGFMEKTEAIITRKDRSINLREMVEEIIRLDDAAYQLTVLDREDTKVRIDELVREIFNAPAEEFDITRTAMFGWSGYWAEPLEGWKIWEAKY